WIRESVCQSRLADELWNRLPRDVSSSRRLCRPNSQGWEAGRIAGAAIHQIRVRPEPADGASARHRGAARRALHGRRGHRMSNRRAFITLISGAAAAWPLAARAQQAAGKIYRIGFLANDPTIPAQPAGQAFLDGLRDSGFIEGKNITI